LSFSCWHRRPFAAVTVNHLFVGQFPTTTNPAASASSRVPFGAGISFFYLVLGVFLALWSSPSQSLAVMGIAAFSSILIAVGFLLSPPGASWSAVTNRSYALIVIAATVNFPL
jgi:hypothetical protein